MRARTAIALALCLSALLAAAQPGPPPAAPRRDLADYGFAAGAGELLELERLNAAVRFDSEDAIKAGWGRKYGRIVVVELADVENRYALFDDEARGRVDVAIRGTANLLNAAYDAEFLKARSEALGINLHSGFEKVAAALYEDIRPRLSKDRPLRVAGHSLGAAEAMIVGMLLERDGYEVELVLASAPPKVTDAEGWARFARLPVVRLAGPYDPVPFLPPRGFPYGRDPYVQGGRLVLLLDGAAFTVVEGSYYDDLPEALLALFAERRFFGLRDHLLPAYLARLEPKAAGLEYVSPAAWEEYARPASP